MNYRKVNVVDVMRYYVNYNDIEKNIINQLASDSFIDKQNAINEYMKYMRISRNFKPKSAEMILNVLENMKLNEGLLSVNELSERLINNNLASRDNIKNLFVASSKFLWLYDNETVIMDNNNKTVLGAKNYSDYLEKWNEIYNKKLIEIENVIKDNFKNNSVLMSKKWFKMRVFDMYLLDLYKN